jgi:hypothetical protein
VCIRRCLVRPLFWLVRKSQCSHMCSTMVAKDRGKEWKGSARRGAPQRLAPILDVKTVQLTQWSEGIQCYTQVTPPLAIDPEDRECCASSTCAREVRVQPETPCACVATRKMSSGSCRLWVMTNTDDPEITTQTSLLIASLCATHKRPAACLMVDYPPLKQTSTGATVGLGTM